MQITKCDICRKKIGRNDSHVIVWLRGKKLGNFELCEKCGEPVVRLLEKKTGIKK